MYAEERETLITMQYTSKTAQIYTSEFRIMQKLDKLCQRFPDQYQQVEETKDRQGEITSRTYRCPRKLIRFAAPVIYTDEQKAKMKERGKALYAAMQARRQNAETNSPSTIESED